MGSSKNFLLEEFIGNLLESVKKILSLKLFETLKEWLIILGDYGLYLASVLVIIIGLIASIRMESFKSFLYGIGFAIAFIIIQFISSKFNNINEDLIKNNETYMTSSGFTEAIGIFALIIGIVYLFVDLYLAIKIPKFLPFVQGIGIFIVFSLISLISFNPSLISVKSVKKNSAGEEAIGILGFFIKLYLKLIPFIYGVGIIYLIIMLIVHSTGMFGKGYEIFISWAKVFGDMSKLVVMGLLPFIAYLFFVLNFLIIDIIKSILLIPDKLDKLSK